MTSDRSNRLRHALGVGLLVTSLAAGALAAEAELAPSPAGPVPAAPEPGIPLESLGIDVLGVRLSGADFLIDLRYRVRDVAKAQQLLERKVHPVLVNTDTGDRYYVPQVPKVGQLKQSATSKQPAQAGKVYFMLFANPDRKLRTGEKVTLHAGDATVENLVVR